MIDPDGAEWLSVSEAARRLRVNRYTIDNATSRGKIRKAKVGRAVYVHMGDAAAHESAYKPRTRRVSRWTPKPG